jgi:hypothetical protein
MDGAPDAARGGETQVDGGLTGRKEGGGLDGRYPLLTQYWRRFTCARGSARLLAALNIPSVLSRQHRSCRSCRQYGYVLDVSRTAGHGLPMWASRRIETSAPKWCRTRVSVHYRGTWRSERFHVLGSCFSVARPFRDCKKEGGTEVAAPPRAPEFHLPLGMVRHVWGATTGNPVMAQGTNSKIQLTRLVMNRSTIAVLPRRTEIDDQALAQPDLII